MEPDSNNDELRRVRKRQRRSLLESRSYHKRLKGKWILARNWLNERMTLFMLIGILVFILLWYMYRLKEYGFSVLIYNPEE